MPVGPPRQSPGLVTYQLCVFCQILPALPPIRLLHPNVAAPRPHSSQQDFFLTFVANSKNTRCTTTNSTEPTCRPPLHHPQPRRHIPPKQHGVLQIASGWLSRLRKKNPSSRLATSLGRRTATRARIPPTTQQARPVGHFILTEGKNRTHPRVFSWRTYVHRQPTLYCSLPVPREGKTCAVWLV